MKNTAIFALSFIVLFQGYLLLRHSFWYSGPEQLTVEYPLILGPRVEPIIRFTDNNEVCREMHTPFRVNCLAFTDWSVTPNYTSKSCWPEENRKLINPDFK